MYTVLEKNLLRFGKKSVYRVHIECDTADQLPTTLETDDMIIAPCSTAYIINERKYLKLNHEGEWK